MSEQMKKPVIDKAAVKQKAKEVGVMAAQGAKIVGARAIQEGMRMVEEKRKVGLTLRSRILNLLGTVIVGAPSSMGMPDDLYHIEADRALPGPSEGMPMEVKRQRIYVDAFRRELTRRVSIACAVSCLVIGVIGWGLSGGINAARGGLSKIGGKGFISAPKKTAAQCEQEYMAAMGQGDREGMERVRRECADVE